MHAGMNNLNGGHRGFTIVETLVTIGILVVVAAGVATIFSSVGETVAKGRRLSELNQFAARMERVMREDFERMTRDGFMVIVNKNANFGQDVQLYRGDQSNPDADLFPAFSSESGRIRRSDEIMFFARGDFESARRAIAPGMIPTSTEAAIYYGHGQKRRPILPPELDPDDADNYFFNPQPWDNNFDPVLDTRLGVSTVGQVNPNEFARDWALLRQVTLLGNPEGPGQPVPAELFGVQSDDSIMRPFLQDSARQVALQPATRSIFTSLSGTDFSGTFDPTPPLWFYDSAEPGFQANSAFRTSGLVDVATEDLSTIRNMIQAIAVQREPGYYFNYTTGAPVPDGNSPIVHTKDEFIEEFYGNPGLPPGPSDALNLDLGRWTNSGGWQPGNATHIDNMRKWMIDALPSRWNLNVGGSAPVANAFLAGVRFEDIPTRIMYPDEDSADYPFDAGDQGDIQRAYAEANQEMLGASVFVPRCTEFVVEWSYGFVNNNITDPANPEFKKIKWYGLDRYADSNNDGVLDPSDQRAALPYAQRPTGQAGADPAGQQRVQGPDPRLIVGKSRPMVAGGNPPPLSPDQVEIATFGFATRPDEAGAVWPWPKLIRITMRLGDPSDRDIEETYQVIFEVPEPE